MLVGPSGCGKTTALRMIAGLEDITSGDLYIGGRRMNDVLERDRDIAMVFQNYALYPHMTVAQNIGFSLKLSRRPKDEIRRRVRRDGALLGLEELLDRRPKQLCGGQRQRVAMGRAIIRQPQAFLMDEPLSNLDAQLRVQMRGEIEALQKRLGVTTVYVTHDQVEAMTMGDRDRGAPRRRPAAGRHARRRLRQAGEPLRRRLHRLAADEPRAGDDRARGRRAGGRARRDARSRCRPRSSREQNARRWRDRPVIVGIRPEDLHGPRDEEQPARRRSCRRRSTGSRRSAPSLLVYFPVDAPPAKTAGIAAATGERGLDEVPLIGHAGAWFCAAFEPRSGVRAGDQVEVAVDGGRLHFFDPESEASVRPESKS